MKRIEVRHWTFLGLFLCIGVVMLLGVRLDIPVSAQTRKMYDYIESLPAGSVLIVSFDHEASSLPEIRPLALAILRHAFSKGHRLIGVALLAEGTVIGYRLMQKTAAEYDRQYGRDYVYLGFKPQYIAAILSMGESIPKTFPQDYLGRPYEQFQLLQEVHNYNDVAAVISITDGSLTTHWMEYGGARYGVKVLSGMTAAMVTTFDPYVASGQMYALVGGLRGAAEYERLINRSGGGARGMLAQSTAHLYVIVLVLLGNLVYFRSRTKRKTG
ncbi:MAG: hypothetical protein ACE5K8_03845 [Candidatus Zixiibacteriota bacterium]